MNDINEVIAEITRRKEACWDLARAERNDQMRQYWNGKYFAFEDVLFLLGKEGIGTETQAGQGSGALKE